jgi:ABC-type dipeptide/oligopeptide/nickel transport system permease subunit
MTEPAELLTKLRSDWFAATSAVFILAVFVMAIFAPYLTQYDPLEINMNQLLLLPGTNGHLLGTDQLGRDLYSRMLFGTRFSLAIGIVGVSVGMVLGVALGLLAAYFKGAIDLTIARLMDVMFAFPGMLLAIMLAAFLGAGLRNLIIAIGLWSVPTFARLTRGSALDVLEQPYVEAARALGANPLRIMLRHVLTNVWGPIWVYGTLRVASAIITGASLSFLGLGIRPPMPEWGALVGTGRNYILEAPHLVIIPSVAISITVLSINILGDWLRDVLDPHLRR